VSRLIWNFPPFGAAALLGLVTLLGAAPSLAATQYDIEVVVFEYIVPSDGGEFWPPNAVVPEPLDSRGYPAAQRRLGGAVARLRQSPEYRVLVHRAWRQPGISQSAAKPILLQSEDGYNLAGTITVWRQRFLHAQLDVLLRPADGTDAVRVRQRRKMRSKELHYLDHPKLGVLIYATPVGTS